MNKTLNIIILFKNRDLQFKALVESLYHCLESYQPIKFTVIYDVTSDLSHMHTGATLKLIDEFNYMKFVKVSHKEKINIEEYFVKDELNLVLPDNVIFTLPFNLKHLVEVEHDEVLDLFKGLNRQKTSINEREGFLFGTNEFKRLPNDYLYHIDNGRVFFESVPDETPFKYYGKIFIPSASDKDVLERKHYFFPMSPCFINAINTITPSIDFYDVDLTNANNAYGLALKYLGGEKIDVTKLKGTTPNNIINKQEFSYITQFDDLSYQTLIKYGCYINLDHREDRREHIENEIKKLKNTQFTRIPGVNVTDEQTKEILSKVHVEAIETNFSQSQKRLGCSFGHINAIKTAKDNGWEYVLIVEDDCVFLPSLENVLENALRELQYLPKWDMLHFGANALTPIKQLSPHIGKLTAAYCAHAYVVPKHFYDTLLNIPIEQYIIQDAYYMDISRDTRYNVYTVLPIVATQKESFSELENKVVNYYDVIINSYTTNLNRVET